MSGGRQDPAIRLLREGDADAFVELRREALRAVPLAFEASPGDDFVSDAAAVREHLRGAPDRVVLGAFGDGLVGVAGLMRDRHRKSSHKARLWGMYVRPAWRRRGVGAGLLRAAVDHARTLQGIDWIHLSVTSAAPAARRLYESAGFAPWGDEPDSLRDEGRAVSELHLALRLR